MTATRRLALALGTLAITALAAFGWTVAGIEFTKYDIPEQQYKEAEMLRPFSVTVTIAGIITADHVYYIQVPCDCSLVAVTAIANSASTGGTIDVGLSSNPDGYLDGKAIGAQAAARYDLDDFNGADVTDQGNDYPHLSADNIICVTVIDGETSPTDTAVTLWFTEG